VEAHGKEWDERKLARVDYVVGVEWWLWERWCGVVFLLYEAMLTEEVAVNEPSREQKLKKKLLCRRHHERSS
jgi:hypothetical protein